MDRKAITIGSTMMNTNIVLTVVRITRWEPFVWVTGRRNIDVVQLLKPIGEIMGIL
jgi:hypothetical protein